MDYAKFQRKTIVSRSPQQRMQAQIALIDDILDRGAPSASASPGKRQEQDK